MDDFAVSTAAFSLEDALSTAYTWATAVHGVLRGINTPSARVKRLSDSLPACYMAIEGHQKIHLSRLRSAQLSRSEDEFNIRPVLIDIIAACRDLHEVLEIYGRLPRHGALSAVFKYFGVTNIAGAKLLEKRFITQSSTLYSSLAQAIHLSLLDMDMTTNSSERELLMAVIVEETKKRKITRKSVRLSKMLRQGHDVSEESDWQMILRRYFDFVDFYEQERSKQAEHDLMYKRPAKLSGDSSTVTRPRTLYRQSSLFDSLGSSSGEITPSIASDCTTPFSVRHRNSAADLMNQNRPRQVVDLRRSLHRRVPSYRAPGYLDSRSPPTPPGLATRRPRSRQSFPRIRDQRVVEPRTRRAANAQSQRLTESPSSPLWKEVVHRTDSIYTSSTVTSNVSDTSTRSATSEASTSTSCSSTAGDHPVVCTKFTAEPAIHDKAQLPSANTAPVLSMDTLIQPQYKSPIRRTLTDAPRPIRHRVSLSTNAIVPSQLLSEPIAPAVQRSNTIHIRATSQDVAKAQSPPVQDKGGLGELQRSLEELMDCLS